MATKIQLEANRANARRSTGPKTPSGKARSSMNGLKHGLTAKSIVIGDEDPAQFELLRKALEEEYNPRSVLARELVERAAGIIWRLRRIPRWEAAILGIRCDQVMTFNISEKAYSADFDAVTGMALIDDGAHNDALGKLTRHESALMNQLTKTLRMLEFIQSQEPAEHTTVIDVIADPSRESDSA